MNPVSFFWSRLVGPSLARYGRFLVLFTVAVTVFAGYRGVTAPDVFRSKASVTIGNTTSDSLIGVTNPAMNLLLGRERAIATSPGTYGRLRLPAGSFGLATTIASGSFEINFFASGPTPEIARTAVEAYVTAYIEESGERRRESYLRSAGFLKESLATAEQQLKEAVTPADTQFFRIRVTQLRAKLLDIADLAARPAESSIERTDEATLPERPTNRPAVLDALVGLIFGLNISAALVLLLDFGHRQRVNVTDIRRVGRDTRLLGVTQLRRLRHSTSVGVGLRTALHDRTGPTLVGVAVVGSRLNASSVSSALSSAIRSVGTVSVHVQVPGRASRFRRPEDRSTRVLAATPAGPNSGPVEQFRSDLLREGVDVAVTQGVALDIGSASTLPLDVADVVVLVIDTLSASDDAVGDAIEVLDGLCRNPVGLVLVDR